MKRIQVVAAVVRRGESILVTRRPDRPGRPGQWEFPGGKVEAGEGEVAALARELREELGCGAVVGTLLLRHSHRYPDLEVDLAFYACALAPGAEPSAIGVAEFAWARVGTLSAYDFLEADKVIVRLLDDLAL